ncbi:hypothetical protein AQUCO_05500088v1 [Aquilegia coerulea]|uniref:At1g61320/AtMIF1 LRR domain-containing protein n=1 Tax=Aquilegia coerulea TaxID=218851 RepID=A0A2G5CH47_AQUCA|nr:hypothetical protein AQUCO_05500088v1 [Aquilegia coerulea]
MIKRGVDELILHVYAPKKHFVLPNCLYSCKTLAKLVLHCAIFDPPVEFLGFSNLTWLDFFNVKITDKKMHDLFSACPLLEQLSLVSCRNLKSLILSNPKSCLKNLHTLLCQNLRKLVVDAPNVCVLHSHGKYKELCLINAPHLLHVDLCFPYAGDLCFPYAEVS